VLTENQAIISRHVFQKH